MILYLPEPPGEVHSLHGKTQGFVCSSGGVLKMLMKNSVTAVYNYNLKNPDIIIIIKTANEKHFEIIIYFITNIILFFFLKLVCSNFLCICRTALANKNTV